MTTTDTSEMQRVLPRHGGKGLGMRTIGGFALKSIPNPYSSKCQKHRQAEADEVAKKVGATTPVGYITDSWGGYWQCGTESGPYTFRLDEESP